MKSTIKALALVAGLAGGGAAAEPLAIAVTATAETAGTRGDADDPAIWVNPTDPAASLILGTDKTRGLFVYGLDGAERAFFQDGDLNNVDLRPFTLAGAAVTLVGASRRDDDMLVFYVIDAAGAVRPADPPRHAAIPAGLAGVDDIYGFAMGQDADGTYAIVNFKSGHVVQWRVAEDAGQIALEFMRVLRLPSQPEGMVADDAAGHLYIGEEDAGIWRVPLAPRSQDAAVMVAQIPSPCLPRDDVEGLAVVDTPKGRFLIASAQGVHRAAVFRLTGDAMPVCTAMVEIAPGTLDGVTETDGLDATARAVGPQYPQGLLVMMDDQNSGFTTNFKLIGWDAIAAALP